MSDATVDVPDAGLKRNAIGLVASVGVGVAATTPAVSVALVFGLLAAAIGVHMPAALILSFLPILLISGAYFQLNKVDPDCGTVFAWATRAFGPYVGWFSGWIVMAALAVIVTNYAQLLGSFSFQLVYWDEAANSKTALTILGVAWIIGLTLIAHRGIELSKRVQLPLIAFEIFIFSTFAIVALIKAGIDNPEGSLTPALSWLDPTAVSWSDMASAFALAVLIYWGWDTSVMINEESENRRRTPGLGAIISTIVLVGFYVLMAFGMLAWAGVDRLAESGDVISLLAPEVFGGTLDHLLIFAGLTSAIAGCLFLPIGGARTMLSMAREAALPKVFTTIHPQFKTPTYATLVFATVSLVYFVGLTIISDSVLADSLTALGLVVALYYALTGLSCAVYFRNRLRDSWSDALLLGVGPLIGGLVLLFVVWQTAKDLRDSTAWMGLGSPLLIAIVIVLMGIVGAIISRFLAPEYFKRGLETAPAVTAEVAPSTI